MPVDVALGALEFEKQAVERATPYEYSAGCSLVTISADDLIVSKAFASRDRDWVDLDDIVLLQGSKVDWDHIERSLAVL